MRSRILVPIFLFSALAIAPQTASAMDPLHLLAQVNHLASQDDGPTSCPSGTMLSEGKCVTVPAPPKKPGKALQTSTQPTFSQSSSFGTLF